MAASQTCTNIRRAGGRIFIQFGKVELEFEGGAQVKQWTGDSLGVDALRAILIAKWLDADPTASNPALVIGKTITADLSLASNIVRVA